MGKCIVIAAMYEGEEAGFLAPGPGDLLICADRGYECAVQAGLKPDLVVGDFDSMDRARAGNAETVVLPHLKDETDTWVCVAEGRRRGYSEFRVGGGLGGRLDHTLANLQTAADCALRGERLWLCDRRNRVTVLASGRYAFPRMPDRYLSFLALSDRVTGVSLSGTRWTLENAELTSRFPLGVSNEWLGDTAELSFQSGILAVFFSADA